VSGQTEYRLIAKRISDEGPSSGDPAHSSPRGGLKKMGVGLGTSTMRRVQPTGRIESMLIHPSIHLDLAHERQRELIARAERQRLAEASRRAALPQQGSVARSAPQQEAETLMKNILSEPHPPGHAPPRELAFRSVDGLEVTLLWNADEDRLTVSVYDPAVPEFFEVPAPATAPSTSSTTPTPMRPSAGSSTGRR
jgi:hypothetical protein